MCFAGPLLGLICVGRAQSQSPEEASRITEHVIVTGTAGGAELRRQLASFAVTELSHADIDQAAPSSSADLLALVPGVWVESSGGIAGANITPLGFPEAGDAPHVTFAINGAPLYPVETLSFLEHSSLFRLDDTIEAVEAQLGGPGAIFSKGVAGLTVNFRLREGGAIASGSLRYTLSDYSRQRVDGVLSGPLSDNLNFMVGGYFTRSPGIRDAQFNAEDGQQLTANLTWRGSRGRMNVFTRFTDDHGQWLLPMAINSGNDPGTFTQLGHASRHRELQIGVDAQGAPTYRTFDFSNGRGWKGLASGLNGEFRLSDRLTLREVFSWTDGSADTYGLVPDGGAVAVAALPQTSSAGAGQAVTTDGATLPANAFVQNYGFWVVQKELESYTNELALEIRASDRHHLTLGYYTARWSSDDFWTLGNFVPFHNVANGALLNADESRGPARACADLQSAGSGSGCWAYGLRSQGDATSNALYLADSFQATDALRLDIGVRRERLNVDYLADAGPGYPTGVPSLDVDVTTTATAYTGALDYQYGDTSGVFLRYTEGFTFPNFDRFRNENSASASIQGIEMAELGFKRTQRRWNLYTTAFYNTTDAFARDVGEVGVSGSFTSRAYGVQLDTSIDLAPFSLRMIGTWQHAVYTDGDPAIIDRRIMRQPDTQLRLMPQYETTLGAWTATIYGTVSFTGSRYADNINSVRYDEYLTLDAGLSLDAGAGWSFRIHGKNLSDRHDPTEGDPRSFVAANVRPILGRSVYFSAGYSF